MEKPLGQFYFNFSSVLLIRTSSHIWGRWYLPMCLFRDGLLTLLNTDFLISLERFLLLPTHYAKIFKWGSMTCGAAVVMNWGGGLQMFLEPLSKCCRCFSNVLLITFQPVTFKYVDYATLFCYVVFIFRCHQFIFQGPSHSWNVLVWHIFYICSWSSHLGPYCKVLWWNFCLMVLVLVSFVVVVFGCSREYCFLTS